MLLDQVIFGYFFNIYVRNDWLLFHVFFIQFGINSNKTSKKPCFLKLIFLLINIKKQYSLSICSILNQNRSRSKGVNMCSPFSLAI